MSREKQRPDQHKKRRTTLSLPAESLAQVERIARARRVNLSTVVAVALSEGLRTKAATERSEAIIEAYRKAFAGFSEEESAILDGIIPDPAKNH